MRFPEHPGHGEQPDLTLYDLGTWGGTGERHEQVFNDRRRVLGDDHPTP